MQKMMANFMIHNNQISIIAQNNQNNSAIQDHNSNDINLGIGNSEELCDGNHDVNTAWNCNTDKDDEDTG